MCRPAPEIGSRITPGMAQRPYGADVGQPDVWARVTSARYSA